MRIDKRARANVALLADLCYAAFDALNIEKRSSHASNISSWFILSDYNCILQGGRVAEIQEQLEESQMTLNTMNAMRHVLPFKERVVNMLSTLSDVAGKSTCTTPSVI